MLSISLENLVLSLMNRRSTYMLCIFLPMPSLSLTPLNCVSRGEGKREGKGQMNGTIGISD